MRMGLKFMVGLVSVESLSLVVVKRNDAFILRHLVLDQRKICVLRFLVLFFFFLYDYELGGSLDLAFHFDRC